MEYTEATEEEKDSHRELAHYEDRFAPNVADVNDGEAGKQSVSYADHVCALTGCQGEVTSSFLHFFEKSVRVDVDCVDSRLLVEAV